MEASKQFAKAKLQLSNQARTANIAAGYKDKLH